ncbi:MAG: haloalkane dehalogenase [Leptospiraceae bacterium]|nr:haloalkane dehalogenase [Leptospiraceae bacterium]
MEYLRTPEQEFQDLEDYPFPPHYLEVSGDGMRMHYVEEGNMSGETVLLLHGEPSWSYLYRHMIPVLASAGFRVIAPDLIGFGKSDKPLRREDYTYQAHMDWLQIFIDKLSLDRINLFCQDWGGLLGLRLVALNSERFSRVMASNTFLPTGEGKPSQGFLDWRNFSQKVKRLPIGKIIQGGCVKTLSSGAMKAYVAPFPSEAYKEGARQFPVLVPVEEEDPEGKKNVEAWKVLSEWRKPFLTAFSNKDPVTSKGEIIFKRKVPGTKGMKHIIIQDAGHFSQEDKGNELAELMVEFIRNT